MCYNISALLVKLKGDDQMKDKQHIASMTLKRLRKMRNDGIKEVRWNLSPDRIRVIEQEFVVEPWLYRIRCRSFNDVSMKEHIVKDIHYACKAKKKSIVRHLDASKKEILDKYGISYEVIKYKIHLI